MTDEKKQEFTLRISQANSSGMVVILYEMFAAYVDDAGACCESGDAEGFKKYIRSARGCLQELMESLDLQYEVAGNLLNLYLYVNRELIAAQLKKDVLRLENVRKVMVPLYEAYKEVSRQDTAPPVMSNTQTVVAGITYGRDKLNENLEDQGASRGYFV